MIYIYVSLVNLIRRIRTILLKINRKKIIGIAMYLRIKAWNGKENLSLRLIDHKIYTIIRKKVSILNDT